MAASRRAGTGPVPRIRPAATALARSGVILPIPEGPEIVIPARKRCLQLGGDGRHARPVGDGDHHLILDREVVHADEKRAALHRIELALGGSEQTIVLVALPARDVAPLPL